ncbi:hypothetical protein [Nodularia sp. LEGE 04288]|uniref:hypothetical protein n=1 Tax=Nodularia sp. LEGE 04288 TaxID=1828639 RepID=UPI001D1074C3|nr:hypothetical protein [Nodularia sp. LEGE 04288]MCC2691595.1 hypothetical protein [Nodularia sp. LEGE 04288]
MTNLAKPSIVSPHEINQIPETKLYSKTHLGQATAEETKTLDSALIQQSQTVHTTGDQLPKPSMRIRYWVYWFRVGLSIFLLLSVLMGLGGCSVNAATVTWNPAVNVVPASVLSQVIVENTQLNPQAAAKNIRAWSVTGKDGKLTVFDFNTPDVCGKLGCLYVGYWFRQNQPIIQVLLRYFSPNLPPGSQLLAVGENRGRALPCIQVLQTAQNQLRQLNYCFNNDSYTLANSQLFAPAKSSQS